MEKFNTWKSVVLWSIISAAFIGPGTVTTAVSAGSMFQLDLLWSVVFATVACIMLQEVAARITIASGRNLGQALAKIFQGSGGKYCQWLVGGAVIAGCAAYEAGNILGAVSGMNLITGIGSKELTIIITIITFLLLWKGNPTWISNLMMFLVVVMGIAFTVVAAMQGFSVVDLTKASVVPSLPTGSDMLILGLIGTTIVPYNIFLGSGISKGQTVPHMRVGLTISVLIGGFITAAILVAGTAIDDFSSFANLYNDFESKLGKGAAVALAAGLFAAGFSSAITSPYASAVIARSVFEMTDERWVRVIWILVLMTGFIIGLSGVKPIPVILFVQALNGLLLPLLVVFLILISNHEEMPGPFRHGVLYNLLLMVVFGVVLVISLNNIDKSVTAAFNINTDGHLVVILIASLMIVAWLAIVVFKKAKESS